MPIIRRDSQELRYNAIWLLPKFNNPDYYKSLFKNTKAFLHGFQRQDLIEELDTIIYEKIEKIMGTNINMVLMIYKNLPTLNSFTHPRNVVYKDIKIYKYTLEAWLDEIENWCFQKVMEFEHQIRFTGSQRQWI